jgi:hypothetical protein
MQKKKQTPIYEYALKADFSDSDWDNAIASALAFLLTPIVVPIMIIASRILGRQVKAFKYFTGRFEEDLLTSYDKALEKLNKDK